MAGDTGEPTSVGEFPKLPIQEKPKPPATPEQFSESALAERELYLSVAKEADTLVAKVDGMLTVTSNPDLTEEIREGHLLNPQGEKVVVQSVRDKGGTQNKRLSIEFNSSEAP